MAESVILSIGEALAEFTQVGPYTPLGKEGSFRGPFVSGAPLIFATAIARLGGGSCFLGTIGQDVFGETISRFVATEGIDGSGLTFTNTLPTSASFVANNPNGTRSFFFHMANGAAGMPPPLPADNLLERIAWLHINGSSLAMNDAWWRFCITVARLVRKAGGRVSLDPNIRPELATPEQIHALFGPILEIASIVFPSGDEAQLITRTGNVDVACSVLRKGIQNDAVVLKQGSSGCTVYSPKGALPIPSFKVDEIDATGAGDTFDAAFLWALQRNASLETAALLANAAGALSVTVTGPIDGLPKRNQLAAFLLSHGRQNRETERLLTIP